MWLSCDEGIWSSTEDLTLEIFIIWETNPCPFDNYKHCPSIYTCINNHTVVGPYSYPTPAQGKVDSRSTNGSQILYIYCSQWYKRKEKGLQSYWQLSCLCLLKYVHYYHLTKLFEYVVNSNKDPVKLKGNLQFIPCHVFRNHSKCDEWCKHKENPEVYRPKNLPYSRYLTGDELLQDLTLLFRRFAKVSEKLIQIGSTQNNESFKRTVATKNPKTHFYSGSESTALRVASAVAQRNDGVSFISKVYKSQLIICYFRYN